MKSMVIHKICRLEDCSTPLSFMERPVPVPGPGEILVRISACGVCHTELDEIEGRTPPPVLPVVPGHEAVGRVAACGKNARKFKIGDRVGVAWIFSACGKCKFCQNGLENLCAEFKATGRDADGGYAEFMTVGENYAYPIPDEFTDVQAAPLLCAGAIGYRSLRLAGLKGNPHLGLTGFGASAHLVLKMVGHLHPEARVYVFARSREERDFAISLGAVWAGGTEDSPPELLDAVIDTTPAWKPVVEALKCLDRGGRLVINAIRKESADKNHLLNLHYPSHLWMEKEIKSVANVTATDVAEFIELAGKLRIQPDVREYALEDANQALLDLKARNIRGAKVLTIG